MSFALFGLIMSVVYQAFGGPFSEAVYGFLFAAAILGYALYLPRKWDAEDFKVRENERLRRKRHPDEQDEQ